MIYNLLFLLVSLFVFLAYRQGLKDGISIVQVKEVETILKKPTFHKEEEQPDFINQYNEILNYNFDKVGEVENG